MINLIIFVVALGLLIFSFVMKHIEMSRGRKIFLTTFFTWADRVIWQLINWFKKIWSRATLKNSWLLFSQIAASIKKLITQIKRRFDHKHSPFFVKRETHLNKNKGTVSFFLKDVSDYKKTLREG